jgi:hypothetical protein
MVFSTSVLLSNSLHLLALEITLIMQFKQLIFDFVKIIFFKPLVFSKLRMGKIHLLNKNLPIKECLKYFGN